MVLAPKDGFIYAYDRKTSRRLYRLPMTTELNAEIPMFAAGVRFCPGTQGGAEWNGPAYDPPHDAVITGQVDWCSTVHFDTDDQIKSVPSAQPWTQYLGGAVAGGVITYDTGAGQKVAVSTGMTSKVWPAPKTTARIYVLAAE